MLAARSPNHGDRGPARPLGRGPVQLRAHGRCLPSITASEEARAEAGPLSSKRPLPLGLHSVAARAAPGTPSERPRPELQARLECGQVWGSVACSRSERFWGSGFSSGRGPCK